MNLNLAWSIAKWVLGMALMGHLLKAPFRSRANEGQRWLGALRKENLAKVPDGLWDYAADTSGCIGCGLCDLVNPDGQIPSEWIRMLPRRPEDAPLSVQIVPQLEAMADDIAKICPTRVDARAVAQILRANADELKALS